MSPFARPSRRRVKAGSALCVGVVAVAGLVGQAAAGPAQAAPNPVDCPTAYPVADVADDQLVSGLTVDEGTVPEEFTGSVLGVLEDGIAPGIDMIMMELSSDAIAAAGGIWQGMSGSPVYAEDGRLIGAVAYGLSWGPTPIAGITPYEAMDDYMETAPAVTRRVEVDRAAAREVAASGEVTVAQAEQGFRHLTIPMGVSGVDKQRLAKDYDRDYLPKNTYSVGAPGSAPAGVDTLVAGGNLAAVASRGDVTFAGVGTTTALCSGRLVGFGHPMDFAGETAYGLAAADALFVQPDTLGPPFKLANIGDLGGTITDDRLAGIAGDLGAAPPSVPFSHALTYGAKNRTGVTDVFVEDALPSVAFYGALGNHDSVLQAIHKGTEEQTWTIQGTRPNGSPLSISYDDRYFSNYDLGVEASFELADLLWALGNHGVTITSVTATADVTDETDTFRLKKIHQRVGTKWVDVTGKSATVQAGRTLRLQLTLQAPDGTTSLVPVAQEIPTRFAGARGGLFAEGGLFVENSAIWADNLGETLKELAQNPRNDQTLSTLFLSKGRKELERAIVGPQQSLVVAGRKTVRIVVK